MTKKRFSNSEVSSKEANCKIQAPTKNGGGLFRKDEKMIIASDINLKTSFAQLGMFITFLILFIIVTEILTKKRPKNEIYVNNLINEYNGILSAINSLYGIVFQQIEEKIDSSYIDINTLDKIFSLMESLEERNDIFIFELENKIRDKKDVVTFLEKEIDELNLKKIELKNLINRLRIKIPYEQEAGLYFSKCKTKEDARKRFKILVKKMHPDNGGNAKQFIEMKEEYSKLWN